MPKIIDGLTGIPGPLAVIYHHLPVHVFIQKNPIKTIKNRGYKLTYAPTPIPLALLINKISR